MEVSYQFITSIYDILLLFMYTIKIRPFYNEIVYAETCHARIWLI